MKNYSKYKRLLVTGGAGFIGSEFVRMASQGFLFGGNFESITIIDDLTYAGDLRRLSTIETFPNYLFNKGNICDKALLENWRGAFDAIIHFAAESHVDRSIDRPGIFLETNILGTKNMLDLARCEQIPIVLVSTDEVYGSILEGSAEETYPLLPSSPYSASKASADLLGLAYFTTYGVDVRITRCVNNFGKYQNAEKFIPQVVENITNKTPIRIYGDGENIRDWIHLSDHCDAIGRVLASGSAGQIYNIGNDDFYTNLEIVSLIGNFMGVKKPIIEFIPDRLGHDRRYAVNSAKIKKELGWAPMRKLAANLEEIFEKL
jgi:dTDP-glucose 4,6-dehydratase